MSGYSPFVSTDHYTREITRPGSEEVIGEVTLRPLNAGDRAEITDTMAMEVEEGAQRGSINRMGTMQRLMLERAIVSWTFEHPVTAATLSKLDPRVFDQMLRHASYGDPDQNGAAAPLAPPIAAPEPSAVESS